MDKHAIEQIATALAHEVKNPLSLVAANVKLLEQSDPLAENKKNYKTIQNELLKINDIIMQFLTIATPVAQDFFELVYISDVLIEIIEKYQHSYPNISFEMFNFVFNYKDPAVLGNESSLIMLFNNIIKNAIEALEKSGSITIFMNEDLEHSLLKITIVDNGPGLSEKAKRMSEVSNNFTTKNFGTGLGLGICNKIAKEHDGSFSIKNGKTVGCIVNVTLPVV